MLRNTCLADSVYFVFLLPLIIVSHERSLSLQKFPPVTRTSFYLLIIQRIQERYAEPIERQKDQDQAVTIQDHETLTEKEEREESRTSFHIFL